MESQKPHDLARPDERALATLVARVTVSERTAVIELARRNDRTPSREVRRAIRFYLTNFDLADRTLRDQAIGEMSPISEEPQ